MRVPDTHEYDRLIADTLLDIKDSVRNIEMMVYQFLSFRPDVEPDGEPEDE